MTTRTSRWPNGVPCWADLSVPDVPAAQRFYAEVLGWSYQPTEIEFGCYTIAQARGSAVAGIGPAPPGAAPSWTMYLAADDVDKIARATPAHGGQVLRPPHDLGTLGRMFIGADPTGARFGVWQAGSHIGARVVNEPGGITWEDLRSPDPGTARAFYSAVFGHHSEPLAGAGPDYHLFALPGEDLPRGGVGPMAGHPGPARWMVYFAVANAETALAAAERAGGQVRNRDFDSSYGRTARVADPAGAEFSLLETPLRTR